MLKIFPTKNLLYLLASLVLKDLIKLGLRALKNTKTILMQTCFKNSLIIKKKFVKNSFENLLVYESVH